MSEKYTTPVKKVKVLDALRGNGGHMVHACSEVGISRGMVYQWLKKDEKFKKEYDEVMEQCIESVEMKLGDIIKDGNYQAINFYLRNKARDRWSEKQTIEQEINIQPIKIEIVKPK